MIGGNMTATIQMKTVSKNGIGEHTSQWNDFITDIKGWLDLTAGGSSRQPHKTKSEDSTYVYLCDYNASVRTVDITKCRFVCNNQIYEIKHIDDPMEIHDHLEITLKLVGVVNA